MTNPFKKLVKTANETQKRYDKREKSETESRRCEQCGAARPKDTNLVKCAYCGFSFMDINEQIKV